MVEAQPQLSSTVRLEVLGAREFQLFEIVTGSTVPVVRNGEFDNILVQPHKWRPGHKNVRQYLEEHQGRLFLNFQSEEEAYLMDAHGDLWFPRQSS